VKPTSVNCQYLNRIKIIPSCGSLCCLHHGASHVDVHSFRVPLAQGRRGLEVEVFFHEGECGEELVRAEGVADFPGQGGIFGFVEVPICSVQSARMVLDVVAKCRLERLVRFDGLDQRALVLFLVDVVCVRDEVDKFRSV
jgi:hypothetical protein